MRRITWDAAARESEPGDLPGRPICTRLLRKLPPVCAGLALAFLAFSVAACESQPLTVTREPAHLELVAAESFGPLAEDLAAAYAESHPWVTVNTSMFNAAAAEEALRSGEADVALLALLQEPGQERDLWLEPLGSDGIAVIAHPTTSLPEVDLMLLHEIFRGRLQEWDGTVLVVVTREGGSGTRAAFDAIVLAGHDVTLTAVVMPSSEAALEHVSLTPGAIGYVSTSRMTGADLTGLVVVPVEGALPTRAAVSDGSYLLWRSLYLASMSEPVGEIREFLQWALGPDGQQVSGKYGNW